MDLFIRIVLMEKELMTFRYTIIFVNFFSHLIFFRSEQSLNGYGMDFFLQKITYFGAIFCSIKFSSPNPQHFLNFRLWTLNLNNF